MPAAPPGHSEFQAGLVGRALAQVDAAAPAVFAALAVGLIARDQGGYFPTSWGWSTLALVGVFVTWLIARARTDMQWTDAAFLLALLLLTVWTGLSITWSVDRQQSVLELERALVLAAGCTALLVLARKGTATRLAFGLLVAVTAVAAYSLWTRLFPTASSFDPHDPHAGYLLFQPVGYWNSLGAFCAIGILVAFGLLSEPTVGTWQRTVAALAIVVLPVTLFFTFSRASWLALGCGLAVAVATSPHRLRLLAEGFAIAIPAAAAVLLASRMHALTDTNATLSSAMHDGHRLALVAVGLMACAAALVPAFRWAERRVRLHPGTQRLLQVALATVLLLCLVGAVAAGGGPASLARRAYDSFVVAEPPAEPTHLTNRLFTLNGNGRAQMWHVAIDSVHGHWVGGTGAGSFERNWDRSLKANEVVRDAHGLFVEVLSELGVVGLLLLVAVLGIPLVAGLRVRHAAAVPALVGAYVTFVLHNAVDWDWELSGVALLGLFVGCILLVARRERDEQALAVSARAAAGTGALLVAAFAVVAAAGNGALARAQAENLAQEYPAAARDASTARTWMPWSDEPLKALGQAQLEEGQVAAAESTFEKATSIDPRDWQAWLDLAASVHGTARARAVARARALYPTSPEIAEFEQQARLESPK